jgi:triacylglycerol lipase
MTSAVTEMVGGVTTGRHTLSAGAGPKALAWIAPIIAVTVCAWPGSAVAAAGSGEPAVTVERSKLRSALVCHGRIGADARQPIVYAAGTGSDGSQVWVLGRGAFETLGRPLCTVSFPDRTTADVQVSVQYLVYAIRATARRAHQGVAVTGISQGGLLARMALTYWPTLTHKVTDVISVAGTQHGVASANGRAACAQFGCPPAAWQQLASSHFLRALNDGRDETPGPTAWTTVRSANDTTATPATGPHPTSALKGATNILTQTVCPGRHTTHIGTAVDSVTIAAITDAVTHRGAARVSRLPADVCTHPYGTGLDEQQTSLFLSVADQLLRQGSVSVPRVTREPRVRAWANLGRSADRRRHGRAS